VLWARDWALVYGSTAVGTAVVLAAYFAGLALGSSQAARFTRTRRGPGLYAALEAGIALSALAYVAIRPLLPAASVWIVRTSPPAVLPGARALLAFGVLLVPTALLGATLPAAAAMLAAGDVPAAGRLYAWNTLGGAAGALACGGFAIRVLGVRGTFVAAAALDVAVAIAAMTLLRAAPSPAPEPSAPPAARVAPAVGLAAAAGFVGLADEVLWTRGLAGVLSNSVYSIALVLAAVLAGLVVGAGAGVRAGRRPGPVRPRVAAAFGWLACTTVGSIFALRALPAASLSLATALHVTGPAAGLAVEAALAGLVVLAPAVCLGAIFPLLLALGATAPGETVGRILAANTAGGIAGALGGAFLVLPRLGLGAGLVFTAGAAAAAAVTVARSGRARWLAPAAVAAAALVAPAVHPAWRGGPGDTLLFYRDGATASVMVTADAEGRKRLRIDGQYSLGGTAGLLLEQREAHLPLLLHPAPARMLALGVGTGDTVGAAVAHPGLRVDAVELVPEVLEAAAWFGRENADVLANPRAHLVVDDARSHLLSTSARYDVILSDLFLPWTAGTAYLYSRDFYRLGLEHLRAGGLYCQWLPLHQLAVSDLATIVATFTRAFPSVQLWVAYHRAATPLAALIGSSSPLRFDAAAVRARALDPGLAAALRVAGLDDPADLAVLYVTDDRHLRAVTADVAPITDDRPRLEFTAPAAYFHQADLGRAALAWVAARLDRDPPGTFALRAALLHAQLALLAGDRPAELGAYLQAFTVAPGVPAVRAALAAIAREREAAGDTTTAHRLTEILRTTPEEGAPLAQHPFPWTRRWGGGGPSPRSLERNAPGVP
jgi:spermidine synthase